MDGLTLGGILAALGVAILGWAGWVRVPPARVTIYYDPANPTTSRLSASMPDTMAMALAIFGGVVLAVAALLALIPNIDRIVAALGS